jgi:hypothetical protein
MKFDTFTCAYIECALWSTTDESTPQGGEPLDDNYSSDDIAPETLAKMQADCDAFRDDAKIVACIGDDDERAGRDFWLTRNGHGAGFWDGDWPEPDSDYLTDHAHSFGDFDLYIGDDGKIHGSPL